MIHGPGAYPRVEHQKDASLRFSLVLPANIRLGWKGLLGTNTGLLRKSVNYISKKFDNIGPRLKKSNVYFVILANHSMSFWRHYDNTYNDNTYNNNTYNDNTYNDNTYNDNT